jgi:hypothetical protein
VNPSAWSLSELKDKARDTLVHTVLPRVVDRLLRSMPEADAAERRLLGQGWSRVEQRLRQRFDAVSSEDELRWLVLSDMSEQGMEQQLMLHYLFVRAAALGSVEARLQELEAKAGLASAAEGEALDLLEDLKRRFGLSDEDIRTVME